MISLKQDLSYNEIKENNELLSEYLINNFNKNIQTFKYYYPEIARKFESYRPQKTMDFFCSVNGVPNLCITGKKFDFYRQKSFLKYNEFVSEQQKNENSERKQINCPKEFSKFLVKKILKEQVSYVYNQKGQDFYGQIHYKYTNKISELISKVIDKGICKLQQAETLTLFVSIGIGLGYHLKEISAQKEILNILLIEPDPDIFFASLHCFEWSEYIKKIFNEGKSLFILIEDHPENIGKQFFNYIIQKGIYQMSGGYFCSIYDDELSNSILKALDKYYYYLPAAYGFFDDRIFGISHTCFSLLNKRRFILNNELNENYKNYPVFVIGSGPSLDNDLNFIKKNQDKAIIIACGTAIDSLYHAGIMPDFYANTERTPEVSQALEIIPDKEFFRNITLLCSSVCHPYVVNHFPKTAIFGKWDENFVDYLVANLDKSCGFKNIKTIRYMNPLVGNMGVSGAISLGFRNIYLFGIDNGKKINTDKMHSAYTMLYSSNKDSDKNGNYILHITVPGNFGEKCETNELYKKSINNIELALEEKAHDPNFTCINCSDGALISYTKSMHSNELDDLFNEFPELDKLIFFKDFFDNNTKDFSITREQISEVIHPEILNKIYDNIIEMISICKTSHKDYLKLCDSINSFISGIRENLSTFFSRTAESSLNSMLIMYTTALYCIDKVEGEKTAEKILDVIIDFLTEAKDIYSKLPDYTLGDHRKHYPDGKVGRDMPSCKAYNFTPPLKIVGCDYEDPVKKFVKNYDRS